MLGIIQARMGSTRLPGKVLRQLADREVLAWVTRAAQEAACLDNIVVATTTLPEDDAVEAVARREGVGCTRGPADDVLSRFLQVLDEHGESDVVRLTADCPLLDPAVIRLAVGAFHAGACDYVGVAPPESLPRGFDVEVVSATALRAAGNEAEGADRSHVTSFVWRNPERFRRVTLGFAPAADDLRVTLDTEDDWRLLVEVVARLGRRSTGWREVVALLRAEPQLANINSHVRQKTALEP